jgi:hypothetical protein
MKLRGEILSVESVGDGIRVKAQCRRKRAPDWEQWQTVSVVLPSHLRAAYYVGRAIEITVEAK